MSTNKTTNYPYKLPINDELMFQAGEIIFDSSNPKSDIFFILEGSVNLELSLGSKKLSLVIESNQFIGDSAVVTEQKVTEQNKALTNISYHAVATALEPVKVVTIPVHEIQKELESMSPIFRAWFASFINRVLRVIEKLSNN
jgi:CRP-like cAMP-binding protein